MRYLNFGHLPGLSLVDRGFLTLAYGGSHYLRMARGLARSIRIHNPQEKIALVTDSSDQALGSLFDFVIPLNMDFGRGVVQKLYMDKYSPFKETIFIDSDCLVFRDPCELWSTYKTSQGFGVRGWCYLEPIDSHYAVKDLDEFMSYYGVERMAAFNSGVYYFDRSPNASRVFEAARDICRNRDRLCLSPFKSGPVADEPIFAMAMELCSVEMLPWDDGHGMSTALGQLEGLRSINVLEGKSRYIKNNYDINPIVIHFNFNCQDFFTYRRELRRLELSRWPRLGSLAGLAAVPEYIIVRVRYYMKRVRQRLSDSINFRAT